jgi:hypothetical protein
MKFHRFRIQNMNEVAHEKTHKDTDNFLVTVGDNQTIWNSDNRKSAW